MITLDASESFFTTILPLSEDLDHQLTEDIISLHSPEEELSKFLLAFGGFIY